MSATPFIARETKITHLRHSDLFDDVSPSALGNLAHAFDLITARPGQLLEQQDTPVRWWNLIVNGHALVERDGTPLGLLGRGESWSEHSLFNRQHSPISVVALSAVTVMSLSRRQFLGLWVDIPTVHDRLVVRSATSADRLALPVYRALLHMEEAAQRRAKVPEPRW